MLVISNATETTYFGCRFVETTNAFQTSSATIQEWGKVVERPKFVRPDCDDLVALIA